MKNLVIKKINPPQILSLAEAGQLLESQTEVQSIDVINWPEYPYRPVVKFRIAHTGKEIWLKYYVDEKYILARETRTNGDVYKDSTVEFFFLPGGKNYYNFEFSCIGTIHLAYGPGRGNRTFVDPSVVEKIAIGSTLGNRPFEEKTGNFQWEMMIRIPIECLAFDQPESFDNLKATANFMKCGDETSEPHFVTWNPIDTENPDYHRPEFFGNLEFEGNRG